MWLAGSCVIVVHTYTLGEEWRGPRCIWKHGASKSVEIFEINCTHNIEKLD
jgi:hypothetical protein